MGYDISLVDFDGYPVKVDRHREGGNIVPGGSTDAAISITYNYNEHFCRNIDEKLGIRWLYGKPAHCCTGKLQNAVDALGTYKAEDYWTNIQGNAGHILSVLLKWAEQYPNAVFEGD